MGSWIVAGLIAAVVAYLVDWVMWSKVFTTGLDAFVTQMTPEEMKRFMGRSRPFSHSRSVCCSPGSMGASAALCGSSTAAH